LANELFTARNANGQDYRVSIIWWGGSRKWINVAQPSLLRAASVARWPEAGDWEVERHAVVAEAAVWQGSLIGLSFRPALVMNYQPDVPQRLNEATFREIVREVVEWADMVKLIALREDPGLDAICHPHRLVPDWVSENTAEASRPSSNAI
jgi:hypothetical protein